MARLPLAQLAFVARTAPKRVSQLAQVVGDLLVAEHPANALAYLAIDGRAVSHLHEQDERLAEEHLHAAKLEHVVEQLIDVLGYRVVLDAVGREQETRRLVVHKQQQVQVITATAGAEHVALGQWRFGSFALLFDALAGRVVVEPAGGVELLRIGTEKRVERLGLRQRLVLDQTAQVVVDEADDALHLLCIARTRTVDVDVAALMRRIERDETVRSEIWYALEFALDSGRHDVDERSMKSTKLRHASVNDPAVHFVMLEAGQLDAVGRFGVAQYDVYFV